MKLTISKSKNAESLYISKSIRINGKPTSKNVIKLGTMASLLPKFDNDRDKVIAWAKEQARLATLDEKRDTDTVLISLSQSKLIKPNSQTLYNGGYLFLQNIFNQLQMDKMCDSISANYNFDYDLKNILSRLIYSRIIFPSSKLSTFELSKKYIEGIDFELHDIYRALDVLAENSDFIQEHLYKASLSVVQRNTSVLYYDCTNYFFEIEEARGDCQFGHCKEHRPNPIIQMGLMMDGNGYPLSFVIFPGNQNEQPTLIPLEKQIIKDFSLSKFIICTDSGLASADNRKFNNHSNRSFIVTQSLKKVKKHIKEWALDPKGWCLDNKKDIDITSIIERCDSNNLLNKNDDIWYKERWINENGIEQRIIVSFSPKYRQYQRSIRSKQIDRAKKMAENNQTVANRNQNSPSRFLNEAKYTDTGEVAVKKKVTFNEDKVTDEEMYDGFYAVCTTLEDPIEEIIKINRRRWEIEESFRIIKSEFEARPVYLQKDNRIKAHFLTCFIALLFIRILESKTKYKFTVSQLITTLKEMNFQHFEGFGYVPTYIRNEITDELHQNFDFRTDYQIISEKNIKKIIQKTKK